MIFLSTKAAFEQVTFSANCKGSVTNDAQQKHATLTALQTGSILSYPEI